MNQVNIHHYLPHVATGTLPGSVRPTRTIDACVAACDFIRGINMITTRFRATAGVVAALLLVFSCQDDAEISAPLEGKWQGTLAEIQVKPYGLPIPISKDDPSFDAQIEFRSDGVMIINDHAQSVEGTYQQSNENLAIDIDYSIEDVNLSGAYSIETLTQMSLVFNTERRGETLADPKGAPTVKGRVKITLHFQRL